MFPILEIDAVIYGDEKVTTTLKNAKFLHEIRIYLASPVIYKPINEFRYYTLR
jgi:hypothetical protein